MHEILCICFFSHEQLLWLQLLLNGILYFCCFYRICWHYLIIDTCAIWFWILISFTQSLCCVITVFSNPETVTARETWLVLSATRARQDLSIWRLTTLTGVEVYIFAWYRPTEWNIFIWNIWKTKFNGKAVGMYRHHRKHKVNYIKRPKDKNMYKWLNQCNQSYMTLEIHVPG